jgi:amino acid transporter
VSEELSKPERQLPLAINSALSITIVSFLVANAAFYVLLPWEVVATTDSVAVVSHASSIYVTPFLADRDLQTAITRLMGRASGIIAAILICVVVAGSLLGNSFVASRMTVAAARRCWLPSFFSVIGRIGKRPSSENVENETKSVPDAPINAVILSALLAALYILLGNFRALLTLNGLGEYSFFFLAVLGAIIIRYREPELRRPYKAFIAFPIIFIVVSGFVVIRGAIFAPVQALIIVAIWAIGLLYYWIKGKWFAPRSA